VTRRGVPNKRKASVGYMPLVIVALVAFLVGYVGWATGVMLAVYL
jgi:hypothetical protein